MSSSQGTPLNNNIEIRIIRENKRRFLNLLLLADEQPEMIDRYLDRGELFALYDNGVLKSICVVTQEEEDCCELKSLATYPGNQRQGYASRLIEYACDYYRNRYATMLLGTGEVPTILAFYEKRGFVRSHRIAGFFTDHYDHPIVEEGVLLTDMIYLKRKL